jgi:hypothetical protein
VRRDVIRAHVLEAARTHEGSPQERVSPALMSARPTATRRRSHQHDTGRNPESALRPASAFCASTNCERRPDRRRLMTIVQSPLATSSSRSPERVTHVPVACFDHQRIDASGDPSNEGFTLSARDTAGDRRGRCRYVP